MAAWWPRVFPSSGYALLLWTAGTVAWGCGNSESSGSCTPGEEHCACRADDSCVASLVCRAGLCARDDPGASGSAGWDAAGGSSVGGAHAGGSDGTGGATTGGAGGTTNGGAGGATSAGASSGGMRTGGAAGAGTGGANSGGGAALEGPCDVYDGAGNACVAAYSTIRRLLSTYAGPLYQIRSDSSATNTGSGGQLHDIGTTADGFANRSAQDSVCANTTCTIAGLYDQSGRGNDITVAKALPPDGHVDDLDNYESLADAGPLTVGGHDVYALYMERQQGYRQAASSDGMPHGQEPQGIYVLADATRTATACCWMFGNVTLEPELTDTTNALFLGTAYWGTGDGAGPWFMAAFGAGLWAGGSTSGDPGWGALEDVGPPNSDNPSLPVQYALGFLKTGTDYALRMADVQTADEVTTAYAGPLLPKALDNQGAVVLGVDIDNSNHSWSTFYEGAIVSGYPSDATEHAILQNIQVAGYGQ